MILSLFFRAQDTGSGMKLARLTSAHIPDLLNNSSMGFPAILMLHLPGQMVTYTCLKAPSTGVLILSTRQWRRPIRWALLRAGCSATTEPPEGTEDSTQTFSTKRKVHKLCESLVWRLFIHRVTVCMKVTEFVNIMLFTYESIRLDIVTHIQELYIPVMKLKQLNGIRPSSIFLLTHVLPLFIVHHWPDFMCRLYLNMLSHLKNHRPLSWKKKVR